MCTNNQYAEPRIFNWTALCSAFSELFYGHDEDSLVDPQNYELVVDTFSNDDLVGTWLIGAIEDLEKNVALLENISQDPEINTKAVEYLKLVNEINTVSEAHIDIIFMVHSDDFEEYLNDKFSQDESINAISAFVDWKALAMHERNTYGKLDLTYNNIGYDGQWLYR